MSLLKKILRIKTPVLIDKITGKEYILFQRDRKRKQVIIGRNDFCDIFINKPYVSGEHVTLFCEGFFFKEYYITDDKSKHGTVLKKPRWKKPVEVNSRGKSLENGDEILLAYGRKRPYVLEFRLI